MGTLKKSVDSLYLLGDRAQKCADRITARARYTDTPAFQGQDGRRVHSVEKYGALRRGRGKNKGYLCWRLDMCLAKLVQNTNTDELIRQTTKLTASFTCTLTKSFNWRNRLNPKQCVVLIIFYSLEKFGAQMNVFVENHDEGSVQCVKEMYQSNDLDVQCYLEGTCS